MDGDAGTSERVVCGVVISISVIGNVLLIYLTKRCLSDDSRIAFTLIFSLAVVHLLYNLVVNVLKIIYASGVGLNLAHCKILTFTTIYATSLAIWFTLYIALLYSCKLCRIVHPPTEASSTNCQKCHLVVIFALWVVGFAVSAPVLPFTGMAENLNGNKTYQENSSVICAECKTEYRNYHMEIFYGKIFLVAIDVLPLLIMFLVSFRIAYLLWKHKKATCGGTWIGNNATEIEVLKACKVILPLIFLIIAFWISHFILRCYLKEFHSFYFVPPVLTVLSSGYSMVSPYLLMLINYTVIIKMKCFCCVKKSSVVSTSPYV
ncbi:olfactory receptor class A-like protein 4 [Tiliqua scincoides]|uniref:olfactory receptor class A-like protein 4 n=1 Tax=Tiliqua scincoides TaxID=71010 RepID=UPI00346274BE